MIESEEQDDAARDAARVDTDDALVPAGTDEVPEQQVNLQPALDEARAEVDQWRRFMIAAIQVIGRVCRDVGGSRKYGRWNGAQTSLMRIFLDSIEEYPLMFSADEQVALETYERAILRARKRKVSMLASESNAISYDAGPEIDEIGTLVNQLYDEIWARVVELEKRDAVRTKEPRHA
jgi:hypothetical protein